MKNILAAFAIVWGSLASAQNNNGIYMTQQDFENEKLSYATNDSSDINKIRFNEILGKPFITIKHNGEKLHLFKDDVFAYKKKRKIVRTCNFVSYTFVEKGPIWIYHKELNLSEGKGVKRVKKYYFSVSGRAKIIPLTINNLKRSYPDKTLFHHFLDAQFRSDADLSLYDDFQNKFKVNHLLETTISETAQSMP